MKKRFTVVIAAMLISSFIYSGCGSKTNEAMPAQEADSKVESSEAVDVSSETGAVESGISEDANIPQDESINGLEAIEKMDVNKRLFDVTLTIPREYAGDITQDQLDESIKEKGYKSATLNEDGSVTYVMTKQQHKEMLGAIRESIDNSLAEMVGSETYPNITDISTNENYTNFTVTTKNEKPDLKESFSIMGLYMYGGMYSKFSGEAIDNVHVDFVNEATGEVIGSSDSRDLEKKVNESEPG